MLEAGMKAPEFALPDQNGKVHTLEEYKGKKVILYFYPRDNTPGCTKQACGFGELYPEFSEKGAVRYHAVSSDGLRGGGFSGDSDDSGNLQVRKCQQPADAGAHYRRGSGNRIPVREGDGAVAGGRTGRQASVSDYRGGCDLSGAFLSDINCSLQEKRVLNHSGQQHFFQLAGGDIKRVIGVLHETDEALRYFFFQL